MNDISKSPKRNTFQKEKYIERCEKAGRGLSQAYLDMFDRMNEEEKTKWSDPASRINNLEYDLRTTDWILAKARASEAYAQNLYAAMCNTDFQRLDVVSILKEEKWGCSWRYAGGIIADMREEGDYIDWYCSGIKNYILEEDETKDLTETQLRWIEQSKQFVGEGTVTDEIRADLKRLGWRVIEEDE
jgi:hypothetical protein